MFIAILCRASCTRRSPNEALLGLGINVVWMPRPTHMVVCAALYDYVRDYMERDTLATQDFQARHQDKSLRQWEFEDRWSTGGETAGTGGKIPFSRFPGEIPEVYGARGVLRLFPAKNVPVLLVCLVSRGVVASVT